MGSAGGDDSDEGEEEPLVRIGDAHTASAAPSAGGIDEATQAFADHIADESTTWDDLDTTDLARLAAMFMPRFIMRNDEPYWPSSFPAYLQGAELEYAGNDLAVDINDERRNKPRLTPDVLGQFTKQVVRDRNIPTKLMPSQSGARKDLRLVMDEQEYIQTIASFEYTKNNVPVYVRVRYLDFPAMTAKIENTPDDGIFELLYCVFFPRNSPYQICGCCPRGAHQADWEHVTVRVLKSDPTRIHNMRFSGHRARDGYWASGSPTHENKVYYVPGSTTRPLVFVAYGSHAMYHAPRAFHRILCFASDHATSHVNDAAKDGYGDQTYFTDVNASWDPQQLVLLSEGGYGSKFEGFAPAWLQYDGNNAPDDTVDLKEKPFRGRISHIRQNDWWKAELKSSNNTCFRCCCWYNNGCLTKFKPHDGLGYRSVPPEDFIRT